MNRDNRSSLKTKVMQLLDGNARRNRGYYYTAPSRRKYPHQWSWDSAFHAIVNCRLGRTKLAEEETATLLNCMTPDGRLPHLIMHERNLRSIPDRILRLYWKPAGRSQIIQPPVVALAVREIGETGKDPHFISWALPLLERHFEWIRDARCSGDSGLASILSPWESGLDHKPGFDCMLGIFAKVPAGLHFALNLLDIEIALRSPGGRKPIDAARFNVREVLFNTLYALGLEALSRLFFEKGDKEKGQFYYQRYKEVEKAILEECYDASSGLYYDIDARTGKQIREPGISCLMPLVLENISKDRSDALVQHLTNTDEYWLNFPVPSVPANSPHFEPMHKYYLWRGSTWMNTNWLIVMGLRKHGYESLADEIAVKSIELVERSGFREYYNPLTGEGGGEKDFGWSTLAAVMQDS